ncbi:hypothetical protein CIPAW_08G172400 [Carya illinoinensis]|uniref:Uncharacterized protein n=1 Tax=Carya illinoinensis TaxID=32201 RepID=A0A8T1Q0Q7_CARIL|nr:hypothetical protein CIPAW_08G172400 [Carya illinoinensis]
MQGPRLECYVSFYFFRGGGGLEWREWSREMLFRFSFEWREGWSREMLPLFFRLSGERAGPGGTILFSLLFRLVERAAGGILLLVGFALIQRDFLLYFERGGLLALL